jgi:hypothetical protein
MKLRNRSIGRKEYLLLRELPHSLFGMYCRYYWDMLDNWKSNKVNIRKMRGKSLKGSC